MNRPEQFNTGTRQKKRNRAYLFIPEPLYGGTFLKWLRRSHAWVGVWGAVIFFLLGLSGFMLNHRAVLQIDAPQLQEVAAVDLVVDPQRIQSPEDLTAWMQSQLDIDRDPVPARKVPPRQVRFAGGEQEQAPLWTVMFSGPNGMITGDYHPGSGIVQVSHQAQNFWGVITNYHKGIGASPFWVLFIDTIAGGLIFMSLSGLLLWSKLHGPRLAAIGIIGTSVAVAVAAGAPALLTASVAN